MILQIFDVGVGTSNSQLARPMGSSWLIADLCLIHIGKRFGSLRFPKSVIHVLRDCPPMRAIWDSILLQSTSAHFFNSDVVECFGKCEMVASSQISAMITPFLYQGVSLGRRTTPTYIIRLILSLHRHKASFFNGRPPLIGWICLHTDGVVNTASGHGTIGGLFRDSVGSWISGFSRSIGMLGLLYSNLARTANSSHALLRANATLRRRAWSLDFLWIPREMNRPTDSIAKQVPPDHFSSCSTSHLTASMVSYLGTFTARLTAKLGLANSYC
ncbi:hypothetical protein V6N11_034063 [Hibiscus sabdariffa]|uniref:RNase H type-1 domain-containing protein n=1 Tax=Hibiscus sabdariffa TaxID=183260 RepID=A0ABR2S192_9ROSI